MTTKSNNNNNNIQVQSFYSSDNRCIVRPSGFSEQEKAPSPSCPLSVLNLFAYSKNKTCFSVIMQEQDETKSATYFSV